MRSSSDTQSLFKRSAIALAVSQALVFQAQAATITVTTIADNETNDGLCSLREAVSAANTNTSIDTCAAGDDNADTIDFDLSLADSTITLAGTELEITAGVAVDGDIDGDDALDIIIDADLQSRGLNVNTTEPVTLNGIKVTKGYVAPYAKGGGIYAINNSDLTITNSAISGNGSSTTDNIYGVGLFSRGTLTMDNSEVSDNTLKYAGNGIGLNVKTATITNCVIANNTAKFNYWEGGGIYASGDGDVTIRNTTISGNSQGGIYLDAGSKEAKIYDSILSDNETDRGGAIYSQNFDLFISGTTITNNHATAEGGGVYTKLANIILANSTVSGNSSGVNGGGLHLVTNNGTSTKITASTIADNSAPNVGGLFEDVSSNNLALHNIDVINSIFADNTNGDCYTRGTSFVLTNSIVEDGGTGCGSPISGDPMLSTLDDFGGSTPTHFPATGSPVIDAGDNSACGTGLDIDADQRGIARDDGSCDIGAVEVGVGETSTHVIWATSTVTVDESDGMVSLTLTRGGDTSADISIDYQTVAGTAQAGQDFVDISGTVNFASGETSKTVDITLLDDSLPDNGDFSVELSNRVVNVGDSWFLTMGADTAVISIEDTDTASGLINLIYPESLATTEAGGSISFQLVLTQAPTSDVIIPIASFDTSEGVVDTGNVTFTESDWNEPQTITVTGVDDSASDGNVSYTVGILEAISGDGAYDGDDPIDLNLTNTDDEASVIDTEIGNTSGLLIIMLGVLAFWRRRRWKSLRSSTLHHS